MSKRAEFQTRMEEALALWSARFDALTTKALQETNAEITARLERWRPGLDSAAAKLVELKRTAGDKWDLVKVEMEKAWHAIQAVLDEPQAEARVVAQDEKPGVTEVQAAKRAS